MVIDSAVNIIISNLFLVNVISQAGFPKVQAAIAVIVGFLIGSITPPVGAAYFYCCNDCPSPVRRSRRGLNSVSNRTVFTFVLYYRNPIVDNVASQNNELVESYETILK